jgi:hypothetical protein
MQLPFILLPLFVQVALTLALGVRLAILRGQDFKSGAVRAPNIALREPNWPPRTMQASYAFSNQFELPVLFYVLTILSIMTHLADLVFVVLAWVFVLSRIAQAYVHVTNNNIHLRGGFYGIGATVLLIMWVIFAFRILFGLS